MSKFELIQPAAALGIPILYPVTERPAVSVKPKKSAMTYADHARVQSAMEKRARKNSKRAKARRCAKCGLPPGCPDCKALHDFGGD